MTDDDIVERIRAEFDQLWDHELYDQLIRERPQISPDAIETARQIVWRIILKKYGLEKHLVLTEAMYRCGANPTSLNHAQDLAKAYIAGIKERMKHANLPPRLLN